MSGQVDAPETIIQAAAAQRHLPVGEDLQQRRCYSVTGGCQAEDAGNPEPGTPKGGCQDAKQRDLKVQVKVIQAGAAVWLPAQQGCDWPVNVMLEVSVCSSEALLGGVDITVIADAITAAQRVVLAHNGPLPLRLQRALDPTAQRGAKAGTTAFNALQGRRMAHVDVPKAGVWVQEHFVFPALTFQKHSDMHPLSLIFAAAVEAPGSAMADPCIATTALLPRTVSMRSAEEVSAALRVLRLPEDLFDRICIHRSMDAIYGVRNSPPASTAPRSSMHDGVQAADTDDVPVQALEDVPVPPDSPMRRVKRERSRSPQHAYEHHAYGAAAERAGTLSTQSVRSVRTCDDFMADPGRSAGLWGRDRECRDWACSTDGTLQRKRSQGSLESLARAWEPQMFPVVEAEPGDGWPQVQPEQPAMPLQLLRLPSLEVCEVMLAELLADSDKGGHRERRVWPAALQPSL